MILSIVYDKKKKRSNELANYYETDNSNKLLNESDNSNKLLNENMGRNQIESGPHTRVRHKSAYFHCQ